MKTISRIAVAAFALMLAVSASADEKHVKLKDLPEAVRKTVLEQSKGGKILALSSEEENGKTTYEAEVRAHGKRSDVKVGPDGALIVEAAGANEAKEDGEHGDDD